MIRINKMQLLHIAKGQNVYLTNSGKVVIGCNGVRRERIKGAILTMVAALAAYGVTIAAIL